MVLRQHSRLFHTAAKAGLEAAVFSLASYAAFVLRFDGRIPPHYARLWANTLPLLLGVRLLSTYAVTRYRLDWRTTSIGDVTFVAGAGTLGTVVFFLLLRVLALTAYPRGAVLLEWCLSLNASIGIRLIVRVLSNALKSSAPPPPAAPDAPAVDRRRRSVLVVGAGQAGAWIARAIKEDPNGMRVVGFADDDASKWNLLIHGLPVLGPVADLPELVRKHRVAQVLVAIPSLPGSRLAEIVKAVEETPAQLTILPGLPQIVEGQTAKKVIRNIKVEDLLERSPVRVNMESIAGYLAGQRVMVTGAGGSIGSELCRQIAALNPEELIIVGQGEHSIFWIENELRTDYGFHAKPVIADIKDRVKLETVFREHRPTVVFHAAAHKHVPLMEANPEEAIKNNVFGTRNLAELAIEYNTRKFVMISTDKAVNPTSVMGTSKRMAEMVVQSLAQRTEAMRNNDAAGAMRHLNSIHTENPVTEFAAVRFGNVLGSRGSVIPTMQRQIEKGGPVTVTHPEMVRFFMTIPEAVQLVIQAGAMSRSGEIFVLEMGKPVKIMDLARNLIRLSGFTPGKDIEIEVTGMRPGEKLYEEVLTAEEGVSSTSNAKICVARAGRVDHEALHHHLDRLEFLAQRGTPDAIRAALHAAVPTYTPKCVTRQEDVKETAAVR